jgi:hypothetical protein
VRRELRTGARLISEQAHGNAVTEILALGGNALFTSSLDATVKVWDCSTLKCNSFDDIHRKSTPALPEIRVPLNALQLTNSARWRRFR